MLDQSSGEYKSAEKLELRDFKKKFPKEFKKVICPSCEEGVGAEDINLQQRVAKCSTCNVIFSIEEELESVKQNREMKQEAFRPEGIDMFYFKDDLDITVQQHLQGLDLWGVCFVPPLALLSIFFYFLEGISFYFPLVLTLGGLYFIYKAFNYSENKTFIHISDQYVNIQSRPKQFRKDKAYAVNDIDQLYLKHSGDGLGHVSIFMVINGIEGQKHQKLLNVNSLSKAKYLEQEIERRLGIENRKVIEATL